VVVHNPSLDPDAGLGALLAYERFRPPTNATYALDARLWGRGPLGFHVTSVALHLTAVVLLLRLVAGLRAAGPTPASRLAVGWLAASVFAVHPLLTQSVAYASGRALVLCAVFYLGAVLAYRRAVDRGGVGWLAATVGLGVAAAASKETGATLPLALLATDLLLLEDAPERRRRRLLRLVGPWLGLVVLAGLGRGLAYLLQEGGAPIESPALDLLTQAGVAWRYVLLFVAPVGQAIVHDVPRAGSPFALGAGPALLGLVAVGVAAWRLRRRAPLVT